MTAATIPSGMTRRRRRGVILVSVLWILIFLAFLAVVLRLHMSGVVASVRATEDKAAIRVLADGGLAMAAALVRAGPQDGIGGLPDALQGNLELETGTVGVSAVNETWRVDLNTGARQLIVGALRASGASDALARRVADEIVRERGGQTPAAPQQATKRRLLQSVAELAAMAELPEDVAVRAERYFTVSSGYEGARLNALDDRLLSAIPDLPPSVITTIRAYRQGRVSYQQMQSALAQVNYHTSDQAISWRVTLSASLPSGYAENYEAVVIISPEDNAPYRVVDWRRLPDSVD